MLCVLLNTVQIKSQDLIKKNTLPPLKGYVSPASTVFNFIEDKEVLNYQLEDIQINFVNYKDSLNKLFVIYHKSDLLYFEKYYTNNCQLIKEIGYYTFFYTGTEYGYGWGKDLVWLYFDIKGKITKKEFYNNGILIESPTLTY